MKERNLKDLDWFLSCVFSHFHQVTFLGPPIDFPGSQYISLEDRSDFPKGLYDLPEEPNDLPKAPRDLPETPSHLLRPHVKCHLPGALSYLPEIPYQLPKASREHPEASMGLFEASTDHHEAPYSCK